MQLQGLMMMLLMMVIIPLMILTSNHEVFFIILSLVLLFSSLRNLYELFARPEEEIESEEEADSEELEDFFGIDVRKLETGLSMVKNMMIILYLIYCSFYVHYFWIKIFIFSLAFYWIYDIILSVQNRERSTEVNLAVTVKLSFVYLSTISIIILTALSKYSGYFL
ncbi:MAG: hypothetical protein N2484_19480 [Clostridia bacterium]|nr:hypothetical protein [Clostridia bacterium]